MRLRVSDQVRNPNHYTKECQHERHQAHRKPRLAIHENGNCCESKRDRRKDRPKYLDRKSTRLNSSHSQISYAVFCLKKKKTQDRSKPGSRFGVPMPTVRPTATLG